MSPSNAINTGGYEDKLLLVLDLDETLVHATEAPLSIVPHHEVPPYFLYLRPGLSGFLRQVSGLFRLAVCPLVFSEFEKLEFVWAQRSLYSDAQFRG